MAKWRCKISGGLLKHPSYGHTSTIIISQFYKYFHFNKNNIIQNGVRVRPPIRNISVHNSCSSHKISHIPFNLVDSGNSLIGAQILSLVAFLLSLAGWWLAWISGLIVVIALWIACCVGYPRVMWVVLAVLSAIAAVGELLVLIGVVDNNFDAYCGNGNCSMGDTAYIIIGIVSLISWLVVASVAYQQGEGSGRSSEDLPR